MWQLSYNRVETEREIPKLKLSSCAIAMRYSSLCCWQQLSGGESWHKQSGLHPKDQQDDYYVEFQYGTETAQTTTNNPGYRKGKFTKVRDRALTKCNSMRDVCKLFGYGNIEWQGAGYYDS